MDNDNFYQRVLLPIFEFLKYEWEARGENHSAEILKPEGVMRRLSMKEKSGEHTFGYLLIATEIPEHNRVSLLGICSLDNNADRTESLYMPTDELDEQVVRGLISDLEYKLERLKRNRRIR